jgi:hypothetical protein
VADDSRAWQAWQVAKERQSGSGGVREPQLTVALLLLVKSKPEERAPTTERVLSTFRYETTRQSVIRSDSAKFLVQMGPTNRGPAQKGAIPVELRARLWPEKEIP